MPSHQTCPACRKSVPSASRYCQECGATLPTAAKKSPAKSGNQSTWFIAGALVIVLLASAAIAGISMSRKSAPSPAASAGDSFQAAGAPAMPAWLASANPAIIADYKYAASHHDALQYIPCYCGCGSQGHLSNSACYFKRDSKGQILAYDDHALG